MLLYVVTSVVQMQEAGDVVYIRDRCLVVLVFVWLA